MTKVLKKENNPKYRIGRSKTGFGAFALRSFAKDDFIGFYTGKRITNDAAAKSDSMYLFDLENGYTLEGATRTNRARYINHSCKPNAYADLRNGRVEIRARRKIAVGEELTFNYGKDYFDEILRWKPRGCLCGHCVGGYSTPWINRFGKKRRRHHGKKGRAR